MSYEELYTSKTLRFLEVADVYEPKYAILGVPYDGTATFRSGSRFAPNAIREASVNIETYSLRAGLDASNLAIKDMGNLNVAQDIYETLRRLSFVLEEQLSKGLKTVIFGGEHTLTLGAVEAASRSDDLTVICFDAHMDFRDEYLGSKVNHATVMRRVSEKLGIDKIMEIGVRAFSGEEANYAKQSGLKFLTSLDVSRRLDYVLEEVGRWTRSAERLYITIDLDVLDPSQAPGVENPEPEGLTLTQLLDILWTICNAKVIAIDIVELSPPYDNGITAIQAAKIAAESICLIEAKNL
ncbi:agmatinase [Candidatus Bathyarchaeota archaeon]|nr:agmatinase [Candidatus Bathyarchaeota archaeon]